MTKHEHDRGRCDAGNDGEHVPSKNVTTSHKAGRSIIEEALRGTEGRDMHIGGGCKDPGGDAKPRHEDGAVRRDLIY
jgi:hypothetical protein